jgi:lysophospholipase L1-like esterase
VVGALILLGIIARAADSVPAAATATPSAPAAAPAADIHQNTAIIPVPQRTEDRLPQAAVNSYLKKHAAYTELAKAGGIDVLFLGDSITDGWHSTGKAVWDKYYGSLKAANFGIGYDRTQHVLWRLQNGEGAGFQPKVVVLLIGTNNAGVNTNTEAAAGVAAVVAELRKDFPDAKILLMGIFPRGNPTDAGRRQVAAINQVIATLDDGQHVFYLDITAKFLDADGNMLPGVMGDAAKLHPSAAGYVIWAEAIKQPLANLLAGRPAFGAAAAPSP